MGRSHQLCNAYLVQRDLSRKSALLLLLVDSFQVWPGRCASKPHTCNRKPKTQKLKLIIPKAQNPTTPHRGKRDPTLHPQGRTMGGGAERRVTIYEPLSQSPFLFPSCLYFYVCICIYICVHIHSCIPCPYLHLHHLRFYVYFLCVYIHIYIYISASVSLSTCIPISIPILVSTEYACARHLRVCAAVCVVCAGEELVLELAE